MTQAARTVTALIDGEPVVLACARLSVAEYGALAALGWPRGVAKQDTGGQPVGRPVGAAPRGQKATGRAEKPPYGAPSQPTGVSGPSRIEALDKYVRAEDGVLVDGVPWSGPLASLFGSREELVAVLFLALLRAQQPTEEECRHLEIAVRFSHWLDQIRRKGSESHWAQTGTDCGKCHELKLCSRRGCDGSTKRAVVWHHQQIVLHTCPVLSFTAEVEETLRLFYWSHETVAYADGSVRWQQRHLLRDGGLSQQDAWLTGAFAWLRNVHFDLFSEARHG